MLSAAMEGARGFLIDGNPKDGAQAEMFEKFIGSTSGVISLSVSDGERMKRLLKRYMQGSSIHGRTVGCAWKGRRAFLLRHFFRAQFLCISD